MKSLLILALIMVIASGFGQSASKTIQEPVIPVAVTPTPATISTEPVVSTPVLVRD
jgi:hypothetical protein